MSRLIGLMLAGLVGCNGTAGDSSSCGRMTAEAEALVGTRLAPQVEASFGGRVDDAAAESRMNRLAASLTRVCPELKGPYRYSLLASTRLNAISLPGGRVYVTSGLYKRLSSDTEVAAVLAHEMAHLVSKDCFKPKCLNPSESLLREIEADTRAAAYLVVSGFDPTALIAVFRLIEQEQPAGWTQARVANISARFGSRQIAASDGSEALLLSQ